MGYTTRTQIKTPNHCLSIEFLMSDGRKENAQRTVNELLMNKLYELKQLARVSYEWRMNDISEVSVHHTPERTDEKGRNALQTIM